MKSRKNFMNIIVTIFGSAIDILVGIGCGIVVGLGGACGGDDAIAKILSNITKLPISICYFLFDLFVLIISLSYISLDKIFYSIITAFISSVLIECVSKSKIIKKWLHKYPFFYFLLSRL